MSSSHESTNPIFIEPVPMMEVDPVTIDAQIATGLALEGSVAQFLNSFESKLTPDGSTRAMIELYNGFDELCAQRPHNLHSERFFDTTFKEFFDDIDSARATVELMDPAERAELGNRYFPVTPEDEATDNRSHDINTLLTYRTLRLAGYSHYDLWQ